MTTNRRYVRKHREPQKCKICDATFTYSEYKECCSSVCAERLKGMKYMQEWANRKPPKRVDTMDSFSIRPKNREVDAL